MSLISLCMIVRDEEATLERCLSSLNEWVDEIVIVDTGSVDDTPRIAKQWADVYHEMEWAGMSASRNKSMDLASGRWCLIVDADEYADPDTDWTLLHKTITSPLYRNRLGGCELVIRNRMMGGDAWERTSQVRLFRNVPQLRYSGKIHNQYRENFNAYCKQHKLKLAKLPTALIHTGYDLTLEERQRKYAARLKVMWAEYRREEGPKKALAGYHLSCMLHSVGDFESSIGVICEVNFDHLGRVMRAQLANHANVFALNRFKTTHTMPEGQERWMREVAVQGYDQPLFLYNLAVVHLCRGEQPQAIKVLCRAYLMEQPGNFLVSEEKMRHLFIVMLRHGGRGDAADLMEQATPKERRFMVQKLERWADEGMKNEQRQVA